MQSVSLEHAEQVLLPEGMNIQYINDAYSKNEKFSHIDTLMGITISIQKTVITRDLLLLRTFHGRGTVDGGPSQ